ncbi:MAG: undecaprenyl-diphosphate phosphatase [Bacilli bacterium]
MIEILKTIFLGIIEGITEWLPISSTGHMLLVDEFIKLNMSESFKEMFFVIIQLGAILAVVLLYFNKLNPFSIKKTKIEKRKTWNIWFKVLIASIPAALIGLIFEDTIDKIFYNYQTIAIALIFYGILFIVIENKNKNKTFKTTSIEKMDYKKAFKIGIFQVLSLIPGTSRSGATIIGGMLSGANREVSAEFTFFLAIPVMFGASLLKVIKFGFTFTTFEIIILLIGMLTAFIISIIVIKMLMKYIKNNNFKPFGYYRIILGILVLLIFMVK